MLSDRASVYDGYGLSREEALAVEAQYGQAALADAVSGAARFAGGEGRGAAGI
jgi:enoyl-CoA hydratase